MGDVPNTFANVDDLIEAFDYKPSMQIEEGVSKFANWYLDFYK